MIAARTPSDGAVQVVRCPACEVPGRLAYIEQLEGFLPLDLLGVRETGAVVDRPAGPIETVVETSHTVGIRCRDCNWWIDETDMPGSLEDYVRGLAAAQEQHR